MKTIFIILVSIVGLPLYAVCVVLLYGIGLLLGWSYVDASVYICEYVQPIFTALLAVLFLIAALRKISAAFRTKSSESSGSHGRPRSFLLVTVLLIICLIYLMITVNCIFEFLHRINDYSEMTNRQIFDFVVHKLREMGAVYPSGSIRLFTGESISYGYIMANMEVYLLPVSIVLLCGLVQWRILRSMNRIHV